MIPVSVGVVCLCWHIVDVALGILKLSPIKQEDVNLIAIIRLTTDALKSLNLFYFSLILLFIVLLWLYSIFDAYQLGEKEMLKITSHAHQSETFPQA